MDRAKSRFETKGSMGAVERLPLDGVRVTDLSWSAAGGPALPARATWDSWIEPRRNRWEPR
jgi:hypothetical protein